MLRRLRVSYRVGNSAKSIAPVRLRSRSLKNRLAYSTSSSSKARFDLVSSCSRPERGGLIALRVAIIALGTEAQFTAGLSARVSASS